MTLFVFAKSVSWRSTIRFAAFFLLLTLVTVPGLAVTYTPIPDSIPIGSNAFELTITRTVTGNDEGYSADEMGTFKWIGPTGTLSLPQAKLDSISQIRITIDSSYLRVAGDVTIQYTADPNGQPDLRQIAFKVLALSSGMSSSGSVGDPVSTASGELFERHVDLSIGGPLPLKFEREYGSTLSASGAKSALGTNWNDNFTGVKLSVNQNSAYVTLFPYRRITFTNSGGVWGTLNPETLKYQMAATSDGYSILDPAANLTYAFSNTGALTSISDRNGNKLTITSSGSQPAGVSDGLGRSLAFTYLGNKLVSVADQTGRLVQYAYAGDNLVSIIDANGKLTRYNYAAAALPALLESSQLPTGDEPFTQEFDSKGRVSRQKDSNANPTTVQYDTPVSSITTVTTPLASTYTHTHDSKSNLTAYTDTANKIGSFTYDSNGRLTSVQDLNGGVNSRTYHAPSGFVATKTDANGGVTSYTYTSQVQASFTYWVLTATKNPDQSTYSYTYDASGNLLTSKDAAGKTMTYTYNPRGEVLSVTNPVGGLIRYTYNPDATIATITDASGQVTAYSYDAKKRVTKVTNPDQTTKVWTYDSNDNVVKYTDERGNVVGQPVDDNSHAAAITDREGNTFNLTRDGNQRPVEFKNALGNSTRVVFDELGRLKSATSPDSEAVRFTYDAAGYLAGLQGCDSKGFTFKHDAGGTLASLADGLSRTWTTTRDKNGWITRVTTPLARNFDFVWDSIGRLASETDPLGGTTQYQRDLMGRIVNFTLPGAISKTFARNGLGEVTDVTDPSGQHWTRTYDSQGRVLSATDPLGRVITYTYNSRSRVSRITMPTGTLDFTYDGDANVIRMQYSGGPDLAYTYDKNNRLLTANGVVSTYDKAGFLAGSNGLAIGRNASSDITSVTLAPGKTVKYVWDCRNLVTDVIDWTGADTKLTWDDARQLTTITRPNGITTEYTYDADGRLSKIVERGTTVLSSITLTRDAAGRIVSEQRTAPLDQTLASGVAGFTYDAAGQIAGAKYDGGGRPQTLSGRSYTWDGASRLASFSGPDGAASFTYDSNGSILSRTAAGATRTYVMNYALGTPVLSVIRQGGQDLRYYIHLPDGALLYSVEAADSTRRYFHFDEIGSTVFLSDATGQVTDSYASAAYGEDMNRKGASDNPFTFLGEWGVMEESGTGLFHIGDRVYDSMTARYLTRTDSEWAETRQFNPYELRNPLLLVSAGSVRRHVAPAISLEGDTTKLMLLLRDLLHGPPIPGEMPVPVLAQVVLQSILGQTQISGDLQ